MQRILVGDVLVMVWLYSFWAWLTGGVICPRCHRVIYEDEIEFSVFGLCEDCCDELDAIQRDWEKYA